MATRIEIDYDRRVIQSDVHYILARISAGVNVLQQLGAAYQSLPGVAMADLEALATALEALVNQYNNLINQLRALLEQMDDLAEDVGVKNKTLLATLRGLLQTQAQLALLDQITGPTDEGPTQPTTQPPGP